MFSTLGSREQAFVYALSAATLTQSVSKACSMGISTKCGCGHLPTSEPNGEFKWGGCGDNMEFGLAFSRTFTDATVSSPKQRSRTTKQSTMNLHNYEAGRQVRSSGDDCCPMYVVQLFSLNCHFMFKQYIL